MATLTNRTASPALRGQGVKVTVNQSEQSELASLVLGATVTAASTKTGTIFSIDLEGYSFIVTPTMPVGYFDSSATPGVLNVGEVITY